MKGSPGETPPTARGLVCGRCGGPFAIGTEICPWCDVGIALEDRHLSAVCARCAKRLDRQARYCIECGLEVRDQELSQALVGAACPRCPGALRLRRIETREITECASCAGIWLAPDDFTGLCDRAEEAGSVRRALLATTPPTVTVDEKRVVYLKCVTCREPMHRRNFGGSSGVIIDVCKDHGVWFDHTELVRVIDYTTKGGLARAREREAQRLKAESERRSESMNPAPPLRHEPDPFGMPTMYEGDLISMLAGLASRLLSSRR